jgi:hypothetical protein
MKKTTKQTVWVTRDGRRLKPRAMRTSHLIAAIRLAAWRCRRRMLSDGLDALAYASSAPDGAAYAAEGAAQELLTGAVDAEARLAYARETMPVVEAMYRELSRRKLTVDEVLV